MYSVQEFIAYHLVVSNSSPLPKIIIRNRCERLLVSVQFKNFILMSFLVYFFKNDLKLESWMENIRIFMFTCVNLALFFIFGFICFPDENDIDGIAVSQWKQRKEETG